MFFFKQKTAYEMRISDWSSDVFSSDLGDGDRIGKAGGFDDDRIEAARAAHQAFDDADQVAANGAADTAIVHLVDFFVGFDDQAIGRASCRERVCQYV